MFGRKKDLINALSAEVASYCDMIGKFNNDVHMLRDDMGTLKATVKAVTTEMGDLKVRYENDLERIGIEFERRLVEFHKEISDKYFQSLESIFKYTREIQLIDSLSKGSNGSDFKALRSALMQPILDYRYKMEKEHTAMHLQKGLENKYTQLIDERNKLHNDFLVAQRHGKDTTFMQGQLDILNKVIKEAKTEGEKTS